MRQKQARHRSGFTLLELMIGFTVMFIIIVIAGLFTSNIIGSGLLFRSSLETQTEVQQSLQSISMEVRAMATSNTGSYPLDTATTNTLAFYSDVNGDGLIDRVRYFLNNNTLERGSITPTGNPLTYDPASEVVTDFIHNIVSSTNPIFLYYDKNYTGSEPPLAQPVNVEQITAIGINVQAQEANQSVGALFSTVVTPRNLRTNL